LYISLNTLIRRGAALSTIRITPFFAILPRNEKCSSHYSPSPPRDSSPLVLPRNFISLRATVSRVEMRPSLDGPDGNLSADAGPYETASPENLFSPSRKQFPQQILVDLENAPIAQWRKVEFPRTLSPSPQSATTRNRHAFCARSPNRGLPRILLARIWRDEDWLTTQADAWFHLLLRTDLRRPSLGWHGTPLAPARSRSTLPSPKTTAKPYRPLAAVIHAFPKMD